MSGNDQDRVLLAHCVPLLETSFFGWRQKKRCWTCRFFLLFCFFFFSGATIDARTHTGLTALHLASECGHSSVVCALLDHNRGPSIYNSKASIDTIESAASSSNDKSLDVNSWTTVENFTALHVAAHSGHVELLELLLSNYKVGKDCYTAWVQLYVGRGTSTYVFSLGSRKGLLQGHSCLLSFSPNSMVCARPKYPQGEKVGSLHLFSNDEYDLLCHINVS